jgi:hypothetical protein
MAKVYSSASKPFDVSLYLATLSPLQAIEILISAHFIPISNYSYSIGALQAFTSCMRAFELVMQKLGSWSFKRLQAAAINIYIEILVLLSIFSYLNCWSRILLLSKPNRINELLPLAICSACWHLTIGRTLYHFLLDQVTKGDLCYPDLFCRAIV